MPSGEQRGMAPKPWRADAAGEKARGGMSGGSLLRPAPAPDAHLSTLPGDVCEAACPPCVQAPPFRLWRPFVKRRSRCLARLRGGLSPRFRPCAPRNPVSAGCAAFHLYHATTFTSRRFRPVWASPFPYIRAAINCKTSPANPFSCLYSMESPGSSVAHGNLFHAPLPSAAFSASAGFRRRAGLGAPCGATSRAGNPPPASAP